jgi:hypothetical protein
MNDWDRNNLEFLLSLKTKQEWDNWANSVTQDDFLYALELCRTAMSEAKIKEMEVNESFQNQEGLDCTQALEIINRVKKESL